MSNLTKANTRMLEGNLPIDQVPSIPNSKLENSSININGTDVSLGGSTTIASGTSASNSPYFKFALAGSATIGTGFPQDDKLNFGTETFKSTGFASWDGSNNRLVPNTAGYYFINAQIRGDSSASFTRFYLQIRKNGTDVATGDVSYNNLETASTSSLIHFNGTSDYVDIVVSHNHSGNVGIATYNANTFLQGFKLA